MSLVPHFDSCLVCDIIRPELGGKLIILGYFGVCPNVDVGIPRLDQPIVLTFLFSGGPGEGSFTTSFEVIDEMDSRVIASAAPLPAVGNPGGATTLASTLLLVFGHPGHFAIRCLVDGSEHFRGRFRVSQGLALPQG